MATSPTQLTLKKLRSEGYTTVQIVERWNAFAKIRQDLFQIIDVLAVKDGETIGIQVTSKTNVPARIRKIEECEHLNNLRDASWKILVHGWYKENNRWKLKEVDVS